MRFWSLCKLSGRTGARRNPCLHDGGHTLWRPLHCSPKSRLLALLHELFSALPADASVGASGAKDFNQLKDVTLTGRLSTNSDAPTLERCAEEANDLIEASVERHNRPVCL